MARRTGSLGARRIEEEARLVQTGSQGSEGRQEGQSCRGKVSAAAIAKSHDTLPAHGRGRYTLGLALLEATSSAAQCGAADESQPGKDCQRRWFGGGLSCIQSVHLVGVGVELNLCL